MGVWEGEGQVGWEAPWDPAVLEGGRGRMVPGPSVGRIPGAQPGFLPSHPRVATFQPTLDSDLAPLL